MCEFKHIGQTKLICFTIQIPRSYFFVCFSPHPEWSSCYYTNAAASSHHLPPPPSRLQSNTTSNRIPHPIDNHIQSNTTSNRIPLPIEYYFQSNTTSNRIPHPIEYHIQLADLRETNVADITRKIRLVLVCFP